jgi:hypothetical protein
MAKCDLTIELDEPDRVYPGGGKITGRVRVHVDTDVNCKALEITPTWRTHGRGNVAAGSGETTILFSGQWSAGDNPEYRFELPIADWPPSYHGHYLNVDHYVDARAKIPWAIDPQASASFMMRPSGGKETAKAIRNVTEAGPIAGAIIVAVLFGFAALFVYMLVQMGWIALIFLGLPLIGACVWFFRVFLPKYLLGNVECEVATDQAVPGESIEGKLVIRPRRNVSINEVTMKFQAIEKCISGSGSNRKTHKHVFYESVETLQPATTLQAGQEHRFPFSVTLPWDAPYSLELDDNNLIWSNNLRVDIPRWPDWIKELKLTVVPSGKPVESEAIESSVEPVPQSPLEPATESSGPPSAADSDVSAELTFAETAGHLWSLRDSREQLATLVEAVTGLSFEFAARVERRLLYGGDDDPHVYKDGYAVWAHYPDPKVPMVLYVPHELADEFEQIGNAEWRGRGTIVGWDSLHGRLQVKIDRLV